MSAYPVDRSRFPPETRLLLLEQDTTDTAEGLATVEKTVGTHSAEIAAHTTEIAVIKTRVAMYSAVGAFVGGGVMSAVVGVALYLLH